MGKGWKLFSAQTPSPAFLTAENGDGGDMGNKLFISKDDEIYETHHVADCRIHLHP